MKAIFIPRVIHFDFFSTRVTESFHLRFECKIEIQIYDRTPNINKLWESSISDLQYIGSEPGSKPVLSQSTVNLYRTQRKQEVSNKTGHDHEDVTVLLEYCIARRDILLPVVP